MKLQRTRQDEKKLVKRRIHLMSRRSLTQSRANWNRNVRDAAAGIKQEETQQQSDPPRTKSHKQATSTTTLAPSRHQTPPPHLSTAPPPWGPLFANPEILGESLENDFQFDVNNPKMDPRYTGICDPKPEDPECLDPDDLKWMVSEQRAIWLGRWFALHYAAGVLEFDMMELRGYEMNKETLHDSVVGPLPALCWTFCHSCLPDDE